MIVWVQVGLLRNSLLFPSVKFLGSTFFENLLKCVYQYFTWTFTDKDFRLCLAIQAKEYFAVQGLFF